MKSRSFIRSSFISSPNIKVPKNCCCSSITCKRFSSSNQHSRNSRANPLTLDRHSVYNRYEEVVKYARDEPDKFWAQMAREKVTWHKPFSVVNESDFKKDGRVRWFGDGQLNVSENCLDRHDRDSVALIWEKDEPRQHQHVTYGELLDLTCQVAHTLLQLGVSKGDRVVIYLPTCPIAIATMLACARIGAIHCVVFAGFSASALAQRINDAGAKLVVTADRSPRGGKMIELKKIVDEAVKMSGCVEKVLVWQRLGKKDLKGIDVDLEKEVGNQSKEMEAPSMNAEDPLFMLYTSGSTGKPKGLVHTSGGYLAYVAWTHEMVFNWTKGDVFACVADIGWITGHSYLAYGALANGITTVLFESTPLYPDPGRYWEMVERLGVNQLYAAPTAIRSLLKKGDSYPHQYDLSSLRTLGSVGEPINTEAWLWYNEHVGHNRCTVVDTWWQTETGGIMISPRPSAPEAEIIPTMAMRPLPGVEVVLIDPLTKEELPKGVATDGDMCITRPWPSMARTIWKDHNRYVDTYLTKEHGYYLTGDEAHQTEENYYRITGRMDDVINISGHRLGTSEVEDAIDQHPQVSESAVVSIPHSIKGEAIVAFVTLKDNCSIEETQLETEINAVIKKEIASFAQPENIHFVSNLPRTRSGKIMRRILKKVITTGASEDLGDISTLADPSAVQTVVDTVNKKKKNDLHK